MYRLETAALLALLSACLAGCATSALDMAPNSPDRPWTPITTATGEIIPDSKIPSTDSSASAYVLPSNLDATALSPALAIDKRRAYTLPELIDIAESNNPTTKIAWNTARNVALAKGIAESTFLPRLSASAVTGGQISNGQTTVQGVGLGSDQNDLHGTISVVSLEWLLFDFGERSALVEAAKQASVISNIAFTAAHQQVIYEVTTAFYADAAARARLRTASQSLNNAESVQVAADDRYRRGVGTVVEVAQARQASAQARLGQVQADGAAKDSYLRLISAMGISPLTQMRVADMSGRRLSKPMYGSAAQTVRLAIARRPDVLSRLCGSKSQSGQHRRCACRLYAEGLRGRQWWLYHRQSRHHGNSIGRSAIAHRQYRRPARQRDYSGRRYRSFVRWRNPSSVVEASRSQRRKR